MRLEDNEKKNIISIAGELFCFNISEAIEVPGHEGGRNLVYRIGDKSVLRISTLSDRTIEDYQAEIEYVHFLAKGGASVADVIPSVNGKLVEKIVLENREIYISCFEYAKGVLISDNGYQYIDGRPLSEYFYNTGKTLGKIHKLSKQYKAEHQRRDYFDKYNLAYIEELIPQEHSELRAAIAKRLEVFQSLTKNPEEYGLIHFDFSDGNYHIDMKTGKITVFDFDNCMNCWYMFDLANLWTHGVGWYRFEEDPEVRRKGMEEYFALIIKGYRSETDISDNMLDKLQQFIDMVLIENVVDEFECCHRENVEPDEEDIEDEMNCLVNNIPFAGFFDPEVYITFPSVSISAQILNAREKSISVSSNDRYLLCVVYISLNCSSDSLLPVLPLTLSGEA